MNAAPAGLYPPLVIAHSRHSRNCRALPQATHRAIGANPLCGDHLEIAARIENGRVIDVAFQGEGCAIARASASLLAEALRGHQAAQGQRLLQRFERLLEGPGADADPELGELSVFAAVRSHPARMPCALLAWDAWRSILQAADAPSLAPGTGAPSSNRQPKEVTTP